MLLLSECKTRNEIRAWRRENGICTSCGRSKAASGRMCRPCAVKFSEYQAARTQRLREAGLCRQCGKRPVRPSPMHPGKPGCLCIECSEKRKEYMACHRRLQ